MVIRVLVVHASKRGATAEIAERIGGELLRAGLEAEVKPVGRVDDLASYSAAVLGSAVYYGRWRRDFVTFLRGNERALAGLPLWIFSSGPTGRGEPLQLTNGWRSPSGLQPLLERIAPRQVALFHGRIAMEDLNFFERFIARKVKAPAGDFREWPAIEAWAGAIAADLGGAAGRG